MQASRARAGSRILVKPARGPADCETRTEFGKKLAAICASADRMLRALCSGWSRFVVREVVHDDKHELSAVQSPPEHSRRSLNSRIDQPVSVITNWFVRT